ncbi:MAG: hypothetical protein WBJ62_03270, partial [Coriobacteriia bacterium]
MSDQWQPQQGQPGYPPPPGGYQYPPPAPRAPKAGPLEGQAEPQGVLDLAKMVLKGIIKTLPIQIVLIGGMFLFTWVLHTYLLVGPNGGFDVNSTSIWPPTFVNLQAYVLGQVLALRGKILSGSAFWFAFSALSVSFITSAVRRKGEFFSSLGKVPARVKSGLSGGGTALVTAMAGAGVALVLAGFLGNRAFATAALGLGVIGLTEAGGGFGGLAVRCFYNDGRKALSKPVRRLPDVRVDGFLAGAVVAMLAFLLLALLPGALFTVLGVGLLVMAAVMSTQGGGQAPGVTAGIVVGLLAVGIARVALADDGGLDEAGGTWAQWIASQGAATAVLIGLPPAIGSAIGAA